MDWLRIPLDQLTWEQIPSQLRDSGRAIAILVLRDMAYQEYLLTEHWKERREARIEFDGHRCTMCPSTGPFHVHHLSYVRLGFEELEDLRTLCGECHKNVHAVDLHQIRAQIRRELEGY